MFDDQPYNYIYPWGIAAPTEAELIRLKGDAPELFTGPHTENPHDFYSLNWLHSPDFAEHWDLLDFQRKVLLGGLVRSSWKDRHYSGGLKDGVTVPEHLLLLTASGCHGNEVSGRSGSKLITSHFVQDGMFSNDRSNIRLISPRAACSYGNRLKKKYDFAGLFRRYLTYSAVIHAPAELRVVGQDALGAQPRYATFYSQVGDLIDWWKKKGWIKAAISSHEISCTSIIGGEFRPHTHLIAFTDDPHFASEVPTGFPPVESNQLLHLQHVSNTVKYMTAAASLVEVYRKELPGSPPLRREFNVRTVNTWANLVYLMKAERSGILKTIRRTKALGLLRKPERGEDQ
jgi:hypothetical protein